MTNATPTNRVAPGNARLCAVLRPSACERLVVRLANELHESCGDATDYRMAITTQTDGTLLVNGDAHRVMSLIGMIADHGESWLISAYCPNP